MTELDFTFERRLEFAEEEKKEAIRVAVEEGRATGHAEGHAEGSKERLRQIIENMYRIGKSTSEIAMLCGVDEKEVEAIIGKF